MEGWQEASARSSFEGASESAGAKLGFKAVLQRF